MFDARGRLLANACRGTRKDIRDAVRAARKAQPEWAARTAFNRGQILYRIAELMEGRRDQFVAEVMDAEGIARRRATRVVDAAIDRWVWYAGWADKYAQTLGTVNPVNGSYFNFSVPEATGVVGLIAPEGASLLGLVSRLAPIIVSGNAAVVIASESRPLPAVTLSEVLATSDVPGGVVNLITGLRRELVQHLAAHMDVNGLDAYGLDPAQAAAIEELGVENVKRLVRPPSSGSDAVDWLSARQPVPVSHRRVRRDQDGLAPHRGIGLTKGAAPRAAHEWQPKPEPGEHERVPGGDEGCHGAAQQRLHHQVDGERDAKSDEGAGDDHQAVGKEDEVLLVYVPEVNPVIDGGATRRARPIEVASSEAR